MRFALLAPFIWISAYCLLLATLLKRLGDADKKKEQAA
jgi:hypothetical protein